MGRAGSFVLPRKIIGAGRIFICTIRDKKYSMTQRVTIAQLLYPFCIQGTFLIRYTSRIMKTYSRILENTQSLFLDGLLPCRHFSPRFAGHANKRDEQVIG
eukprot:GEMP01011157.1.p2 GENE.GEMP01011157.1~~GEMP01011157.1.p2  ORF type:complete len:101 (-),score=1.31 GEMP01011157.1:128-430(-)